MVTEGGRFSHHFLERTGYEQIGADKEIGEQEVSKVFQRWKSGDLIQIIIRLS